jgi:hypothetical protein
MTDYGPYHRLGGPGGPGCEVGVLPVKIKGPNGSILDAQLLDGGATSSELELLRTVAKGLGVNWGHDDFGWWACVPNQQPLAKPWWRFW